MRPARRPGTILLPHPGHTWVMTRRCQPPGGRVPPQPPPRRRMAPARGQHENSGPCHTSAFTANVHRQGLERHQQATPPALTGTEPGPDHDLLASASPARAATWRPAAGASSGAWWTRTSSLAGRWPAGWPRCPRTPAAPPLPDASRPRFPGASLLLTQTSPVAPAKAPRQDHGQRGHNTTLPHRSGYHPRHLMRH